MRLFERVQDPRWYFVEYDLPDVVDEGVRNLDLKKYVKSQIGINMEPTILIQKRLFDQLSSEEQAGVLLHEMLWTAIGRDKTTPTKDTISGKTISSIVSLLMDPYLDRFTSEQIADEVGQHINFGFINYDSGINPWEKKHEFLPNLIFELAQMPEDHPVLGKTFTVSVSSYETELSELLRSYNAYLRKEDYKAKYYGDEASLKKLAMKKSNILCNNYYLQGYASINRIELGSKFTCETKISECKIQFRPAQGKEKESDIYSCPTKVVTAVTP